jgi:hypothetical protein
MYGRSRVLIALLLTLASCSLSSPAHAQSLVGADLKKELLRENLKAGSPLTPQQIDEFYRFMTEPKAEMRQQPSIDVGFYDSPGPATDRTIPLGNRTPLILVHGSGSDVISDGSLGRPLDDKERWIDYLDAFNSDPQFSSLYKVYRFVYDSRYGIDANAGNLITVIDNIQSYPGWEGENLDGKEFVALAHSMGGLVSRAAMNKQFTIGMDANVFFGEQVINLVTLGTPHRGSPWAVPLWVYDSAWRNSGISETEYRLAYIEHWGFEPYPGEFDLAWDNYDDALPRQDMYDNRSRFTTVAGMVGGGSAQHLESINSPYPAALNAADAYSDRLILFAAENPPEGWVDTILELTILYAAGTLNEHHLLGFSADNLADVIAGDIGEGDVKPYGENDGLVPLQSATFAVAGAFDTTIFDTCDHLTLLDELDVIIEVTNKLKDIVQPAPMDMWMNTSGGTL